MNRSIVCGVDGTRASRWAARVAGEFARGLDRTLVLVHVAREQPTFPYGDPRLRELQRRDAAEAATILLERTGAEMPDVAVEPKVVFGDAAAALMTVSADAELLVVGSRGRGPLASAFLGSVSAHVATEAPCPVIVVPSVVAADRWLARPPHSRIVCGIDDSVSSARALRVAGALAERLRLELALVHVEPHGGREDAPADGLGALTVRAGEPVETLREETADPVAGLLVVGSRGRTSWRAALGSVSRGLAASAPVPVMVVPPTADMLAVTAGTGGRFIAST